VPQTRQLGLFLGAGASFELGMPRLPPHRRVQGVSADHLKELNTGWRALGGGFDESVIAFMTNLLQRQGLHYENILGCLQTMSARTGAPFARQYLELYVRMIEIVYLLPFYRQTNSLISRGLHGSLNIFAMRDGLDLCRLRPGGQEIDGR
jgi:hypothetical protein